MNVGTWCIRNNRTAGLVFLLLVAAGLWTYLTIPRLEDPSFTIRTAVVATPFPGSSPRKVEKLVTDKLEDSIREMAEVEWITSQSMAGLSVIHVRMADRYQDMQPIWQRLRNKVRDCEPELPDGVVPPVVNDEFGDVYGILLALTGDGYTSRELKDAAEDIRNDLLTVRDVAKVKLHGVQEESIFVEFSNALMAQLGFSPRQLMNILQAQNSVQPSGDAVLGPERVLIESTGEFQSLEDLRETTLRIPGQSESVSLKDITSISREVRDPPRHMVRFNGREAVVLAVSMVDNGNIVGLGKRIQDRMARIQDELPVGLDLQTLMFQPDFVQGSIRTFTVNLLEAFGFVVVVMFVFVGWRTGFVAGSLVPMAMLTAITLMPFFGVKLQIVSIGALIISLGMLVDNGVVVSEHILVDMASGTPRLEAAGNAVRRLWLPLLTASLTTIFAFLPIPLAKSMTGEYTMSLFTVVTLTLLSSWILSMTFVPVCCHAFLRESGNGGRNFQHLLYRTYRAILLPSLKARGAFVAGVVLLMAAAGWGFTHVPSMFFPPNEREIVTVEFWQPYGTDIQTTAERAARLDRFLRRQDQVSSTGMFIGYGGPRWYLAMEPEQTNKNYVFFVVNTRSVEGAWTMKTAIEDELDRNFPDCRASVRLLERGPPVGAPIQVRLSGQEVETINTLRHSIAQAVKDAPGTTTVWDDWGEPTKKLVVDVNQERAKRAGLSTREIALSLQAQFSGIEISQYREEEDVIPIMARSRKDFREDLWKIEGLNVYSYRTRQSVPLLQVATPKITWQPSNIRRRNGVRTMTIKSEVARGVFASEILNEHVAPVLRDMEGSRDWPQGYDIDYGGEFEESSKANTSILINIPLVVGLVALILVGQFNSYRRVIIIGLTVPPMFVGVTGGMLATGSPFGFMALLGMISLVGIIVNNAIMMIDQIEIERARSQTRQDALVIAAQKRLRPIIMTAATTILGLVPLSLQGGELWRPMANVLIFGLAFSTLLTLVLCPVLYSVFFRIPFQGYTFVNRRSGSR